MTADYKKLMIPFKYLAKLFTQRKTVVGYKLRHDGRPANTRRIHYAKVFFLFLSA